MYYYHFKYHLQELDFLNQLNQHLDYYYQDQIYIKIQINHQTMAMDPNNQF
jgi:hypothetical protein